ncbi:hypothetical protein SNK04_013950 [Fusarium graminearum]
MWTGRRLASRYVPRPGEGDVQRQALGRILGKSRRRGELVSADAGHDPECADAARDIADRQVQKHGVAALEAVCGIGSGSHCGARAQINRYCRSARGARDRANAAVVYLHRQRRGQDASLHAAAVHPPVWPGRVPRRPITNPLGTRNTAVASARDGGRPWHIRKRRVETKLVGHVQRLVAKYLDGGWAPAAVHDQGAREQRPAGCQRGHAHFCQILRGTARRETVGGAEPPEIGRSRLNPRGSSRNGCGCGNLIGQRGIGDGRCSAARTYAAGGERQTVADGIAVWTVADQVHAAIDDQVVEPVGHNPTGARDLVALGIGLERFELEPARCVTGDVDVDGLGHDRVPPVIVVAAVTDSTGTFVCTSFTSRAPPVMLVPALIASGCIE